MGFAVLIPLSIGLGLVGLAAFFWALRSGQFDDPEGAAWRVIPTPSTSEDPPVKKGTTDDHMACHPEDRNTRGGL